MTYDRAMRRAVWLLVIAACTKSKRDQPAHPVPPVAVHEQVIDAAPPDAPPAHTELALLHRDMCLGTCPVYTVTVFENGDVEYDGRDFVKQQGRHDGHLTPDEVRELRAAFAKAGWSGFATAYTNEDATDHPSAQIAFTDHGKRKLVDHYHGDFHAPKELSSLEAEVDRIVHIEQFIGTPEERAHLKP
jgi:hypothetical protein